MKKICFALLCALAPHQLVYSFEFHPTISLLTNYTITKNTTDVRSGTFDIQNRKMNVGFELTNKFHLDNSFFIKTGLRYTQSAVTVRGKNQMSSLYVQPYQLNWETDYGCAAIPVHIGKDFTSKNGNRGDVYIGASAGIMMLSGATYDMGTTTSENIKAEIVDNSDKTPSYFSSTADFGMNYQPFKNASGFTVGIMGSVQLNKTGAYTYGGTVTNITTGQAVTYDLRRRQSIAHCGLSLSYTFSGKRAGRQRGNKMEL